MAEQTSRYYTTSSDVLAPTRNESKAESKANFCNESDISSRSPPSSLSSNDSVYFSNFAPIDRSPSPLCRSRSTDYGTSSSESSRHPCEDPSVRGGLRTRRPAVQTTTVSNPLPLCGAKTTRGHCSLRRVSCPWAEHRSTGARSPLEAPCLKHPQYTIRSCRRCAQADYRKACFG
jgi:hypothetical protein